MAFRNVIRRAVSSTIGTTGSQRHYHHKSLPTLFSNSAPSSTSALSQNLFFSSFSTETTEHSRRLRSRKQCDSALLQAIDSEIQDAVEDLPENFPFKIKEEPVQQDMILTRSYDDAEIITVAVNMSSILSLSNQSPICMCVRVSKPTTLVSAIFGYREHMDFDVYAYPDRIEISSSSIAEDKIGYRRSNFGELDENLQKAFYKYLDIRGINLRLINFLQGYMKNKDNEELLAWLKMVKKRVEA